MKLSHTKRNKYLECPARYNFHYNLGYRTKELSSSLFFGTALDEALNILLETKLENPPKQEKTPKEVFLGLLDKVRHNGETVRLIQYESLAFTKADYDSSVYTEESFFELSDALDQEITKEWCDSFMEWYNEEKKKKSPEFTSKDHLIYRMLNLESLKQKGLMILEAYEKEVIPQIHRVYSIQDRVNLPNDTGDSIDGLIDFTASFVDDPSIIYICDNKTASKAYKQEDLDTSDQLHLYAYYKELENVAYIVCEKEIRKREPRVRISILKGRASEDFTDNLLDCYQDTLYKIKEGNFNPNFESGCNFFRKRCEYWELCHKDTFNDDILVKVKKK
jgi:hypothetical protein